MSKVWQQGNNILMADGQVVLCEECPCDEPLGTGSDLGTGSVIYQTCCDCLAVSSQYEVTIAGVSTPQGGSNCDTNDCQELNGTFLLNYDSNCSWVSDDLGYIGCNSCSPAGSPERKIILNIATNATYGPYWRLIINIRGHNVAPVTCTMRSSNWGAYCEDDGNIMPGLDNPFNCLGTTEFSWLSENLGGFGCLVRDTFGASVTVSSVG